MSISAYQHPKKSKNVTKYKQQNVTIINLQHPSFRKVELYSNITFFFWVEIILILDTLTEDYHINKISKTIPPKKKQY